MADKKILSFDEFLAADGVDYVDVLVRGGVVRLGSITGEDFVAWTEMRESSAEAKKDASALLISRSMVDGAGKRIGDDGKVAQIKKMNLKTTETLLKAIFKLNGINQPDEIAVKKS